MEEDRPPRTELASVGSAGHTRAGDAYHRGPETVFSEVCRVNIRRRRIGRLGMVLAYTSFFGAVELYNVLRTEYSSLTRKLPGEGRTWGEVLESLRHVGRPDLPDLGFGGPAMQKVSFLMMALVMCAITIAVIYRLHDLGRSGWWLLAIGLAEGAVDQVIRSPSWWPFLTPFSASVFTAIALSSFRGDAGSNAWGARPWPASRHSRAVRGAPGVDPAGSQLQDP